MKAIISKSVLALSLILSSPGLLQASEAEQHYARCVACHLADGQGIPGAFPPLKNRLAKIASSELGRQYLVQVLNGGLMGMIKVNGQTYSGVMPAQTGDLSAQQIANLLNYATEKLDAENKSKSWQPFSEQEIKSLSKNKGNPVANANLRKQLITKQPELN